MNILIIGNTASVGHNLMKGLLTEGHHVVLCADQHSTTTNSLIDHPIAWKANGGMGAFDVIHVMSPNIKKYHIARKYLTNHTKLICHWHGSDLRHPLKSFPLNFFFKIADAHLFSTIDLQWWLRFVKKPTFLFKNPVDTNTFVILKKLSERPHEKLVWRMGTITMPHISHDDMPKFLNDYKEVTCQPADGLSPYIISVSALEAASCGCTVTHHPYMTREWVQDNASIDSQVQKLLEIYTIV